MVKQYILDILVKKIKNADINPNTGEFFKVEDIKITEYRNAVQEKL